jgi:hypothetical protein
VCRCPRRSSPYAGLDRAAARTWRWSWPGHRKAHAALHAGWYLMTPSSAWSHGTGAGEVTKLKKTRKASFLGLRGFHN